MTNDYKNTRALLFDLGNVLIDVDFLRCARMWSERSGVPLGTLTSRFRIDAAYRAFECGAMASGDYFEALRRQLQIDLSDDLMRRGWQSIIRGEKPGIRRCLARLKPVYPLYIMTNTNSEHEYVWADRHRELLADFKAVFVSSRMGCRKPDAEAYHKVAHAVGHPLDTILFFDDAMENVEGARQCGMPGILVDSRDTIKSWTERLLCVTNG